MSEDRPVTLPLIFVLLTVFIDAIGVGLIMPVMPSLLTEVGQVGLADAALLGGILTTAFAVMQFLCGPTVGALSDRFGRRPVLLISLFVMALDYLVMAVAQTFALLLVARIVGGIVAATQSTAYAFIADISKPEQKAARFGLISAAFGLGFVAGPVIGGLLAEYGTRAPFYAAALIAAANFALGCFVLPETLKNRRPMTLARSNPLGAFAHVGADPGLRRLLFLFFVYQVAFFIYPAIWAFFTEARFGWSPAWVGASLAAFGLAQAVVQGVLIRFILSAFGDRGTVLYGLIFNTVAFLVIAMLDNGMLLMAFVPLVAFGAVVVPALQSMLSRRAADDAQGELQGVISSTAALAIIVSPMLMTGVFATWGETFPGAPFILAAVLTIICIAIYTRIPRLAAAPAEPETSR